MDGLETLRALRDAADFKRLPVVMLTAERNEAIVQQIIGLGVLEYMTKPLVSYRIVERLRRVVRWMHSDPSMTPDRSGPEGREALEKASAFLIVDGREEVRAFFAEMLGPRRTILQAETGARGFRMCLEQGPGAVFVGSQLGVLNDSLLVRKIRSTPALRDTYLVAIVDGQEEAARRIAGYDGKIVRTHVPEAFLKQFELLSRIGSGALHELLAIHPGLQVSLVSAAEQVFGMMLSVEVSARDVEPTLPADRVVVSARGSWTPGSAVSLRGCCDAETGRRVAAHLLGIDPTMVDDEDVDAAVCELFTAMEERFSGALAAKPVPVAFDQPAVSRARGAASVPEGSIAVCLQSVAGDLQFWLVLEAEERETRETPAERSPGARPEAEPTGS